MPSVFQLSRTLTCGEFMGMPKCSTIGGWPSLARMAPVISRSPAGAPDVNTLRALMRYPPSTGSAFPDPAIQSEPPLDSRMIFSAATRFSSGSTAATFWWPQRHAGIAT
jgi:hypothetical protein